MFTLDTLKISTMPPLQVRIGVITRADHPCVGQRGLFAAEALTVGQKLLRYCGIAKARTSGDAGGYLFAIKVMYAKWY